MGPRPQASPLESARAFGCTPAEKEGGGFILSDAERKSLVGLRLRDNMRSNPWMIKSYYLHDSLIYDQLIFLLRYVGTMKVASYTRKWQVGDIS